MQLYGGLRSDHGICRFCGKRRSEHKPNDRDKRASPFCPSGTGLSTPQPTPIKNKGVAVYDLLYVDIEREKMVHSSKLVDLILADAKERDIGGEKKYGTRLGLFDGRDVLVDPYQEAMDLCVYLRKAIAENHKKINENKTSADEYWDVHQKLKSAFAGGLSALIILRQLIFDRDGK